MQATPEVEAVAGHGLRGDAAYGTARRQVLLIDAETLAEFGLTPGASRENITTEGIRLQGVPRGSRLRLGDVVLEITGDCTPCDYFERFRSGMRQELVGKRGLLARVERGGTLRIGDPISLATPALEAASG
jgi:MOSC domain-containing protein YiiM